MHLKIARITPQSKLGKLQTYTVGLAAFPKGKWKVISGDMGMDANC